MDKEKFSSILLIFAFAALLAMLSVRRRVIAAVMPPTGASGGPTDFSTQTGDAGYMNYNWGMPPPMSFMMPQTSQGGSLSPQCGVC